MTEVVHSPDTNIATSAPYGGFRWNNPGGSRWPENDKPDFVGIHGSAEFAELRRRFRRFVFPMSALFFLWYLTYLLLAIYARDLMSHRVAGAINVGLVLGLLQFGSTLAITVSYLRFARKRIDPQVLLIRTRPEPGSR